MAVVFSRTHGGKLYEVRTAGRARRLYTDGVFHSQYNPARPFTGGLWDLLSLPALCLARASAVEVLILGVGGGAVIRQLQHLLEQPVITGIDIDELHLEISRRWFGVEHARLIRADAIEWVASNTLVNGGRYDLIIDDLFTESNGEPVRVQPQSRCWADSLFSMLAPDGVIVVNDFGLQKHRTGGFRQHRRTRSTWVLRHPQYENGIAMHLERQMTRKWWQRQISAHESLDAEARRLALARRLIHLSATGSAVGGTSDESDIG